MAHTRLWTFELLRTPMLGTEKLLQIEPAQLYQEYGMDITGNRPSVTFWRLKDRDWFGTDGCTTQVFVG